MCRGTFRRFSFQYIHPHRPSDLEAKLFVYSVRGGIVGIEVQKRGAGGGDYPADLTTYQPGSIPPSGVVGMRANGADLGVGGRLQALSDHGYQLVSLEDSLVLAQVDGAGQKRPRPGEGGKLQHGRNVLVLQRYPLRGFPTRKLR